MYSLKAIGFNLINGDTIKRVKILIQGKSVLEILSKIWSSNVNAGKII